MGDAVSAAALAGGMSWASGIRLYGNSDTLTINADTFGYNGGWGIDVLSASSLVYLNSYTYNGAPGWFYHHV